MAFIYSRLKMSLSDATHWLIAEQCAAMIRYIDFSLVNANG